MNPEKKIKSLVAIVVFLLLSNIAMIIFFVVLGDHKKSFHSKEEMANKLKNEVGFSPQQIALFDTLRTEHFKHSHQLFENIRTTKENFYNLLYNKDASDSAIINAADKIGQVQKTLDMQMFQHLRSVRNICTRDQLPKFDSLIKKVVVKMTGGGYRPGSKRDVNKSPK